MSNIKQLKHLEHLEDEMLNYGVEGCKAAVSFLKELKKMLGHQESGGINSGGGRGGLGVPDSPV